MMIKQLLPQYKLRGFSRNFFSKKDPGFTLIELLLYMFITSLLLLVISSLVINTFNGRKQLKASDIVNHDARFIINFLINRIHNVDFIDDVSPAPEQILFYISTSTRFSLTVESDNLVYRQTEDTGSGFPDQSTAEPIILNSVNVKVSDLSLTAMSDNYGNPNQGVNLNFTLSTGNPSDSHGYIQQNFNTFMSIR